MSKDKIEGSGLEDPTRQKRQSRHRSRCQRMAVDLDSPDAAIDLAQRIADSIQRELSVLDEEGELVVIATPRPRRLN